MQKKLLSENIKFENGKRVTTQSIEIITSLSDDRATLANYYGTLAALQSQLEQVQAAHIQPEQRAVFDGECTRIRSEMAIIEQAIVVQGQHIRGFESADQN